jgi:hypothetical protein
MRQYAGLQRCKLGVNFFRSLLAAGIAQIRYLPTPDSVPPVPAAVTKISTLPAVSFQISGPDIFRK